MCASERRKQITKERNLAGVEDDAHPLLVDHLQSPHELLREIGADEVLPGDLVELRVVEQIGESECAHDAGDRQRLQPGRSTAST